MGEVLPGKVEPLRLVAAPESLQTIRQYVRAAAARAGLDQKVSYKLCLAVDEIATNIISYGYAGSDTPGQLCLQARVGKKALVICLEDDGRFFDPTQAATPDITLPLDERPVGGLGIFLARQSVDKLYCSRKGNYNRTFFGIKRPAKQ